MSKTFAIGLKRTLAVLGLSSLFILFGPEGRTSPVEPFPFSPGSPLIKKGLDYIKRCQNDDGGFGGGGITEWVIIAIGAAGQDPGSWKKGDNSPIDYLKKYFKANTIWDYNRIITALSFAALDPRSFCGENYVEKLKREFREGQLGDPSSLRDDYWGIIALAAAGEADCEEVKSSAAFIKRHQNEDGSWKATTTNIETCADNTSVAIIALIAAGEEKDSPVIKKALAYLKSVQQADGGFPYLFVPSNAATDSWVIQGLMAAGENPADWHSTGGNLVHHLSSLQEPDGSFKWTEQETDSSLLMTAYALPALLGNYYNPRVAPAGLVTVSVRIEGRKATIYDGVQTLSEITVKDSAGKPYSIKNPTALSVLEAASEDGAFHYSTATHALGLYVQEIGREANHWEYRVNDRLPLTGADRCELNNGDEVTWFMNEESFSPLRLSVSQKEVATGEPLAFIVERFDESKWIPSAGGVVRIDSLANEYHNGSLTFEFDKPGTFTVFAESAGCIRSQKKTVQVWPNNRIGAHITIQGSDSCVWDGQVSLQRFIDVIDMDGSTLRIMGHSIIGALAQAASLGGFQYRIKQTSQGLIIVSIAHYAEDNKSGSWWYEVNGEKVMKDVDEARISEGDTILLYYDRSPKEAD